MNRTLLATAIAAVLTPALSAQAADSADMAEVKRMIEQLKGE